MRGAERFQIFEVDSRNYLKVDSSFIRNMRVDTITVVAVELINRIGAVAYAKTTAGLIESAVTLVHDMLLMLVICRDLLFTSPLLVKAKSPIFYDAK